MPRAGRPFCCATLTLGLLTTPGLLMAQGPGGRAAPSPGAAARREAALQPRTTVARRIAGDPPRIDGRLDDAVWRTAEPVTDFIQGSPAPGALATLPTSARVLYDGDAVYIALRLADPHPDSIVAPYPRRDDETTSDWAFVEIDSRFDRRSGFSFGVNPRGVQADGAWSNDVDYDGAWNGVWEAAASIDSLGWSVEFRIPFSQLALVPAAPGQPLTWGINFYRYTPHRGESSNWSPRLPSVTGVVSHFNRLVGLAAPARRTALQVVPYTAVTGSRTPVSLPGGSAGTDLGARAGADFRYQPGSGTSLALSLHPDFGQVEADPSQINLTTFETFLPEQRPLFVDDAQLFRFGQPLEFSTRGTTFADESPFYSRRIGRAPARECPPAVTACRRPAASTVLGAFRATGRTASGWSGGVLQAWTDAEYAHFSRSGLTGRAMLAPLSHFTTARAVRELSGGRGELGAMATFTGRLHMRDGVDSTLARGALVLGADGRIRLAAGTWELSGAALASRVTGTPAYIGELRQEPRHLGLGEPGPAGAAAMSGISAQAALTRIQGRLQWGVAGRLVSPGFESNDLGFQRNADWLLATLHWKYLVYNPGSFIRRWYVGSDEIGAGWTFAGRRRATVASFKTGFDLRNYWGGSLALEREFPATDPETLRGGPALRVPGRNRITLTAYTDTRRRWQATLQLRGEREAATGSLAGGAEADLSAFVTDRLQLGIAPELDAARESWQYAAQAVDSAGGAHYLVGRLREVTAALTARATLAFSSHLTLQLYSQIFLSGGTFDRFKEVVAPDADRPADRVRPVAPARLTRDAAGDYLVDGGTPMAYGFADPAFAERNAHLNVLLRWEFRPGSTLFLVWAHEQAGGPVLPFRLGRDLSHLWDAPSGDALQLKVSYWMGV